LHETLRSHVAALSYADLDASRKTNWGELRETRWLISTLMQHDTYHAGEINHVRSLLAGNDRRRWGQDAYRGAMSHAASLPDHVMHRQPRTVLRRSMPVANRASASAASNRPKSRSAM